MNNYDAEEHDYIGNSKKVTVIGGTISAAGQVTVTPLQAWPDPKTYIGLVTVTGSLSAAAGNITLDPGSKTQIVGNITLSDPKGFIGLVTVVGSLSPAAGNITLDPGSRTGLVGNVTLTDSKGYIGLVTATVGNVVSTTFAGNVTLDPGSKTQIVGNVTLTDSKGYVGLVTATIGNSPSLTGTVTIQDGGNSITVDGSVGILGNVTLSDPKGFIGLVTVGGGSVAISGTPNVAVVGNVTLSDSKGFIGLVSIQGNVNASQSGTWNVTTFPQWYNGSGFEAFLGNASLGMQVQPMKAWPDPHTYIGLVTITGALSAAAGNITLDPGSKTGLVGTVTIQDGGNSITIDGNVGVLGNVTLTDSKGYIGLVTSTIGNNPVLGSGVNSIGFATVSNAVAWPDPKTYIGLVTITGALSAAAGNITLDAGSRTGLVGTVTIQDGGNSITVDGSVGILGNVTLSDSKGFVGLVTAWTRNAGTTKTLIPLPIGLGNNSLLTVAVPTNAQKINVTQLVLNSNITTEIAIKSGVTYLTGNASIGVTLFPGGGFVMSGSPDSPSWIGCASGAMVVEKRDGGGTVSKVGGNVIYFDE